MGTSARQRVPKVPRSVVSLRFCLHDRAGCTRQCGRVKEMAIAAFATSTVSDEDQKRIEDAIREGKEMVPYDLQRGTDQVKDRYHLVLGYRVFVGGVIRGQTVKPVEMARRLQELRRLKRLPLE